MTTNGLAIIISQQWFLFMIGFFGMISHFLKQYQQNQLSINTNNPFTGMLKYFFKINVINTLLTVISYIVVFFIMYQMKEQGILAAFSAGYMSDSLFNKAEEHGISIK